MDSWLNLRRDLSTPAVVEHNKVERQPWAFLGLRTGFYTQGQWQAQKLDEGAKVGNCHCPSRFRGLLG